MVGVFFHLRQYMKNPNVIQQLIDAVRRCSENFSTVIMVGPVMELPPELWDLVTYCDNPLPDREQLKEVVDGMLSVYKDSLLNSDPDGTNALVLNDSRAYEELLTKTAMAAAGLTAFSTENAVALSMAMTSSVNIPIIRHQKEQAIRKSEVLEFVSSDDNLDTVGGMDNMKLWIKKRSRAFSDEAKEFGLPWPKGIMVVGPPGVGKSLSAKAVANFLGLPLLRLDIGRVFGSLVGQSEERIRNALSIAEAVSPVVLQIDELEKNLAGHQSSGRNDSGVTSRVVATLLTWRQETTYPVFIVATVNDPEALPPMILRRGRFDQIFAVDLPRRDERQEIFKIHILKKKRDPDMFNLSHLAERTEGFSGAELESFVNDALFSAFYDGEELSDHYILQAIADTKPQIYDGDVSVEALRKWMESKAMPASSSKESEVAIPNAVRTLTPRGRKKNAD